jgi:predicted amidohydrolase YtcJ
MKRTRLRRALGLAVVTLLVMAALGACAFFWVRAQRSRAELVVRGRIVTLDPRMPEAQALAARDGRIIAIGTDEDVDDHVGWWTHVVEVEDGYAAVPGLVGGPANFIELASGAGGSGDPQPPGDNPEQLRRLLGAADRDASSRGITSFRDTGATPAAVEQVKRMIDERLLHTRLWVTLRLDEASMDPAALARATIRGYGDHRLTVSAAPATEPAAPDDDLIGTLAPGKLADMTVVAGDVSQISEYQVREPANVAYTIVGGQVVYESDAR